MALAVSNISLQLAVSHLKLKSTQTFLKLNGHNFGCISCERIHDDKTCSKCLKTILCKGRNFYKRNDVAPVSGKFWGLYSWFPVHGERVDELMRFLTRDGRVSQEEEEEQEGEDESDPENLLQQTPRLLSEVCPHLCLLRGWLLFLISWALMCSPSVSSYLDAQCLRMLVVNWSSG